MDQNNINQNLKPQTPIAQPTPSQESPLIPPVQPPVQPPYQQGVSSFGAPKEPKPYGPMIGTFIIIALLIAAAVYFWGQKINNDAKMESNTVNTTTTNTTNSPQLENTPPSTPAGGTPTTSQPKVNDDFTQVESSLDASVQGLDDFNY